MRFNIVSQNQRLTGFCKYLQSDGHEVTVVNGEFPECDIMIYDTQFKQKLVSVKDCIRIEYTDTKKGDDFSISFNPVPGAYQIQDSCSLLGEGTEREELVCDIVAVNQDLNSAKFINRYKNLRYCFKIFNDEPVNSYNYCGIIRGKDVTDAYKSAKVSICLNRPSVLMALESGGNVITDSDYGLGLSSSQVFYKEEDFYEKVDALLNGHRDDTTELRNRLLKEKSPFNEWANIFRQVKLNKLADKIGKTSNRTINALYFK
jgi:hypothetical protein